MSNVAAIKETVASAQLAARVKRLVEEQGYGEAQRLLGISRGTVLALIGRQPVRPATLAVADMRAPR